MRIDALRGRMRLVAFILLALVCLALFGFACACLSDHPAKVHERAIAASTAVPAIVEVWPLLVLALLASGFIVAAAPPARARGPSPPALQRFLL